MLPEDVAPKGTWVTWAEVDLDALAHNVRQVKAFVGDQVEVIAVVKADAYGHGMVPVARTALQALPRGFPCTSR